MFDLSIIFLERSEEYYSHVVPLYMAHFCAPRSAPRDPRSEAELLRQLTSRGRRKARRLKEQRRSAAQVLWHKIIILYPGGACNFSEYLRKEKPWNTKEKLYKINVLYNLGDFII